MTADDAPRGVTRRLAFWVAYAVLAAVALAVTWVLFPLAIPLVNLDIKLSRADALAEARTVAARLALAPADARTAARFRHDQAVQNYVELEGGGKAAFAGLVAGGAYVPYWWEVRLFLPGEVAETVVRFRPDGTRYGFVQKRAETFVPEAAAGLALDADAARRLAEDRARADWGIDLAAFALLEATQQKRITGRVDHTFVYQRTEGNLGESRFRLRLVVTGDALTEVAHFVHVPEAFERRYAALRSANKTLAGAASLSAGVLYGLGGCVFGVLWLLRRRWLLWRQALVAGLVVGGLLGATALAGAPAAWFAYDTAQSTAVFWARQVGGALLAALLGGLGYGLVFMAAESLARRAFPEHPQLWRVWSRRAAPTPQVLGRTLGGYLFVPLELAFVAGFYYASNRWLGWWQPSEALTDPNILGSAVPALAPIAISLQAGFMEECLFRAVPLALAALIGARFGRRGLAIGVAIVVQALIFGGAHASYPGLPAYSRLVELVVPSVLWALIFLRYGLLPTILLHALFDLTLFAIPLFLVDAPGAGLQRALVIGAGLAPLAFVVAWRLRAGGAPELAADLYNAAWRPPPPPAAVAATASSPAPAGAGRGVVAFQRVLPWLGAAGLALWLVATPFRADVPGLPIDRAAAVAAADAALAARGVALGPEWTRMATTRLASDSAEQWRAHKFVWREGGRDTYAGLVGSTLAPPLWEVRYAKFDGDVPERAEEWRVTVAGDGKVRQVRHALPEARPGAALTRSEALARAEREAAERFGLDPAKLKAVGAEERQRPARGDWRLVFAEPEVELGAGGEARIEIVIAGDEVASSGRYVHVPEAWERAERERDGRLGIVRAGIGVLFALAGLLALIAGIRSWAQGQCDRRALVLVAVVSFVATAVAVANKWPLLAMNLRTAEPVAAQASLAIFSSLAGGVVTALLLGLAAGVGAWAAAQQRPPALAGRLPAWGAGVAAALFAVGAGAALARFAPATVPLWPQAPVAAHAVPALGAVLHGVGALTMTALGLFVLHVLERLTGGWQRHRWSVLVVPTALMAAAALAGSTAPWPALVEGAAAGVVTATVVWGLLRFDARALPAYCATVVVLRFAELTAPNGSLADGLHVVLVVVAAAVVAWRATAYLARARAAATVLAAAGPRAAG
jgi:hypothetical protein